MTKEVVILESVEQSIIYKALKDSKILSDLATKILHGKPVPEDHIVGKASMVWFSKSPYKGVRWERLFNIIE